MGQITAPWSLLYIFLQIYQPEPRVSPPAPSPAVGCTPGGREGEQTPPPPPRASRQACQTLCPSSYNSLSFPFPPFLLSCSLSLVHSRRLAVFSLSLSLSLSLCSLSFPRLVSLGKKKSIFRHRPPPSVRDGNTYSISDWWERGVTGHERLLSLLHPPKRVVLSLLPAVPTLLS